LLFSRSNELDDVSEWEIGILNDIGPSLDSSSLIPEAPPSKFFFYTNGGETYLQFLLKKIFRIADKIASCILDYLQGITTIL
jgi:hypothetical protein